MTSFSLECDEYKDYLIGLLKSKKRIVGGEAALKFEFPHMAAIGWTKPDKTVDFKCGGTLISRRYVLTAAHCVPAEHPDMVRLREHKFSDIGDKMDYKIARIIKHPEYKTPALYNDIALLELGEAVV